MDVLYKYSFKMLSSHDHKLLNESLRQPTGS